MCPADAKLLSEEIFGPVAPVTTFTEEQDAIEWANATEYGLVAYVFTRDIKRAFRVIEGLETGMVGLNQGLVSNAAAPFGGVKQSGFRTRGRRRGHRRVPLHEVRRDQSVRAVVFAGAGGTEVVEVQERPDPVAGKGEVVVESVYAGVNPADLAQMAGKYPVPLGSPKDIPGLEVSGRVVELGADVSRWKLGDRVFGVVGGGGLATRVVVHERHVAPVPEVLDDLQAAAIPEAYVTAHDAIVTQAGLRMGERLLVNGASGGVGLAAVQIGVATGATVFAYARSAEAREKLAALGATPVESPEEASDIQVVLELVGAPNMEANFKAIAVLGRIIVVGNGAGLEFPMNLRILMGKRARLMGTLLRARPIEQKAEAVLAFERQVVPQIAAGRCTATIDSVFPIDEARAAYDRLAASGKYGKVLVQSVSLGRLRTP